MQKAFNLVYYLKARPLTKIMPKLVNSSSKNQYLQVKNYNQQQ